MRITLAHNTNKLTRRDALARTGTLLTAAAAGASLPARAATPAPASEGAPFLFCLNTATIRGQKLGIVKEVEVASKAGFQAIEPWIEAIDQYAEGGGSLKDLRQRIADAGRR